MEGLQVVCGLAGRLLSCITALIESKPVLCFNRESLLFVYSTISNWLISIKEGIAFVHV